MHLRLDGCKNCANIWNSLINLRMKNHYPTDNSEFVSKFEKFEGEQLKIKQCASAEYETEH